MTDLPLAATLAELGLAPAALTGGTLPVHSPVDGSEIARLREHAPADADAAIAAAQAAFLQWRQVPAPLVANWSGCSGRHRRAAVGW